MTYEEADAFAIVFLKGAASLDTVMNEAAMSKEEATEGIISLAKKGLLAMVDDGVEYTANEYGDCIAVRRNPPLWGLTPAAKKTAEYKLMVAVQAHLQKRLKEGHSKRLDEKTICMIRQIYNKGTRLELKQTDNPQAPPIGTRGTVTGVDDSGRIMVNWDNGICSNVIPFVDECWIVFTVVDGKG